MNDEKWNKFSEAILTHKDMKRFFEITESNFNRFSDKSKAISEEQLSIIWDFFSLAVQEVSDKIIPFVITPKTVAQRNPNKNQDKEITEISHLRNDVRKLRTTAFFGKQHIGEQIDMY